MYPEQVDRAVHKIRTFCLAWSVHICFKLIFPFINSRSRTMTFQSTTTAQLAIALAVTLAGSAAMAQAKAPEPDYTLAFNVGVVTDYRFRGISQTSFLPALQGGLDFSHKSGFYAGAWLSNIRWIQDYLGASDGSYEVDLYAGFKGEIAKDFGFDIGVITYQYPGNTASSAGFANANTFEIYGALTYGPVTVKYSRSTGDFIGNLNSSGSGYLEAAATFDLGNGFSITPHIGRQSIPNQVDNNGDYTDYSLSVAKDFGNGIVVTGTLIGTDAKKSFYTDPNGRFLGKDTVVVGLKYSF
jgi:uncharacterized protein (TIGR02001 family)